MAMIARWIVIILGLLAIAMGLLWAGQGTGVIMWPAESFMLAERQWAIYGVLLAATGAVIVWLGRRIGR